MDVYNVKTLTGLALRGITEKGEPILINARIKDSSLKMNTIYCYDDFNTKFELSGTLVKDEDGISFSTLLDETPDYFFTPIFPRKNFIPKPRKVIFNGPATIVYWEDGSKTVVKAYDEEFDEEKGLAMAFVKKIYNNKGNYNELFKKWAKE